MRISKQWQKNWSVSFKRGQGSNKESKRKKKRRECCYEWGISLTIVIGDNHHSSDGGDGDVISGGPCETEREGLLRFTDQVIGQVHIHTTLALTGSKRQRLVHCHIVCWTLCTEQTLDDLVASMHASGKVIGRGIIQGLLEAPNRKRQGVIAQQRPQSYITPSLYLCLVIYLLSMGGSHRVFNATCSLITGGESTVTLEKKELSWV